MSILVKQDKEVLINYNTCMAFNYDLFSKIKIPKELTSFKKENSEGMKVVVEIKDSKGRKFVFSSNRGGFIWISKYLLTFLRLDFISLKNYFSFIFLFGKSTQK